MSCYGVHVILWLLLGGVYFFTFLGTFDMMCYLIVSLPGPSIDILTESM